MTAYGSMNNAYLETQISTTEDPIKLIQMLYGGAVKFLEQAARGSMINDVKMRGEALSRSIAIIGELNASLDIEAGGETALFLRDLYMHILCELPKVNLDNDVEKIQRSLTYIRELKRMWEERVMKNSEADEKLSPEVKKTTARSGSGDGLSFAV